MMLRHEGSYGLREFPFEVEKPVPPERFQVDRWTPNDDLSKDKISGYKQVREGWLRVKNYPLWYGFEEIDEVSEDHLGEYFDLVIIRPTDVGANEVLDIISNWVR